MEREEAGRDVSQAEREGEWKEVLKEKAGENNLDGEGGRYERVNDGECKPQKNSKNEKKRVSWDLNGRDGDADKDANQTEEREREEGAHIHREGTPRASQRLQNLNAESRR